MFSTVIIMRHHGHDSFIAGLIPLTSKSFSINGLKKLRGFSAV